MLKNSTNLISVAVKATHHRFCRVSPTTSTKTEGDTTGFDKEVSTGCLLQLHYGYSANMEPCDQPTYCQMTKRRTIVWISGIILWESLMVGGSIGRHCMILPEYWMLARAQEFGRLRWVHPSQLTPAHSLCLQLAGDEYPTAEVARFPGDPL